MPELRQNLATKEWVIIATERARRPEEFVEPTHARTDERPDWLADCPFCPGNEELDLEVLRIPQEGAWQLRVVCNKYPALQREGERTFSFDGIHRMISGVGHHEVLIETPRHNSAPALQRSDEVALMLRAFQLRGQEVTTDPRVQHLIYFKNHGVRAGTSLLHPHTQLIGLPVVPHTIRLRTEEARRYFDDHGMCVFCKMIEDELSDGVRIVMESEHFVAFVPFAAFSPFHLWILPRRHHSNFLDTQANEIADLGHLLRQVLRKFYVGLNDPDYNYVIRSAPIHDPAMEYLHWYLALVPRVSRAAGFELGSGMFINIALPEASAAFLREVKEDN
ncbi:MAG: HIT domain-containing protein [Ardenticatenales bacterium]|nr:HIT domain-containing protein [Ardenticatenales bacterium]